MTNAMEVLFSYAQEWLEKPLLLLEPEYENALRHADSQEQRLRAALNDGEAQLLDSLIDERNTLFFFHQQAMFRAGFQLALELSR
ncbi:MAG: hypothetical protein HDT38_06280 [Clostridiales bacterium]|nr:hypothetical protein [Clostridiales bacterium]